MSKSLISVGVLIFISGLTNAQTRSITVVAEGSAQVKADQIRFSVTVDCSGESAKAAYKEFNEKRKKFNTDFNVMKFRDLKRRSSQIFVIPNSIPHEEGGVFPAAVGIAGVLMAPQADNIYAINETIDYTLVNADKKSEEEIHKQLLLIANELAKLEASFNGFESVTSDPDAAEISAMESAVKNARRKAQALAKLADGNLGKILNIEPVELESEDDMETMFNNMFMGVMPGLGFGANPYGLANGIRTRISSKCKLKITFELTD